ncbi:MAG: protein kinase [Ignavibacteriales bacterium]|nr:MAG: protein kinase [Ignavibacteriales bacterium]
MSNLVLNLRVKLSALHLVFLLLFALAIPSCNADKKETAVHSSESEAWYKQVNIDLGYRIKMYSADSGYAVSRGRGSIPGGLYKFENGKWQKIFEYPYSDYPLIASYDSSTVWFINHLVHNGKYKPVLNSVTGNRISEIELPQIMWDETDYSMWKSLWINRDKSAWLAGQQGNIIFYSDGKWQRVLSPVERDSLKSLLSGDINDLFMLSASEGWGVGKDGLIIKYELGYWKKFKSPVSTHLNKICMVDSASGWIVGQKGTILKFNGTEWEIINSGTPANLNSVKTGTQGSVYIAGDNSTLLTLDQNQFIPVDEVKYLEDNFIDIEIIDDENSGELIWLLGDNGIYTNSKSIGFSFTDFTNQASLHKHGKGGIFFNLQENKDPSLFVMNEDGPSLLFANNGNGIFSETKIDESDKGILPGNSATAIGDINNDGYNDLIQLYYGNYFRLLTGSNSGYDDRTVKSQIDLTQVEPQSLISTHFWDLNNDGNLDLFISNDEKQPLFFLNDGTGKFKSYTNELVKLKSGARSFGATLSDFNNDGLIDIFFPYQTQVNNQKYQIYLNMGNMKFSEYQDSLFFTNSSFSASATVSISEDFNNDGLMDLFIHQQKAPPVLLLNSGSNHFKDASYESGFREIVFHPEPLNGIVNAADVNNDGWIDIYVSSKLYLNSEGCRFTEVSEQTGITFTGNPSFSDVDDDGDMDLFIGSSEGALGKGDRAVLYRNNLNNNNYLKVIPVSDESNRSAVGTVVTLSAFDRNGNEKYKSKKVFGFGSSPMLPQSISEIHFGINPDFSYKLLVEYPSGKKHTVLKISPGDKIYVNESNLLVRNYFHVFKDLERTINSLDYRFELIKLFLFIVIVFVLKRIAVKNKIEKLQTSAGYYISLFIIFLISLHYSIDSKILNQIISTSTITFIFGAVILFIFNEKQKRDKRNLISHYRIAELLGTGGMGKVYRAIDINTNNQVALKVINPELLKDQENKNRFAFEGNHLSAFKHKNIVRVFESVSLEDNSFIAMELLEGGSLKQFLNKHHPLTKEKFKNISIQVCEGLKEIHSKKIIHRDIKTTNLMFDSSGVLKIMDFGISKSTLVTTMTSLGTVVGTLGYVAPEQVTNTNADERSDIYSLGVVMYEMATNRLPFNGENEIALIHSIFNTTPELPSTLNDLLTKDIDEIIFKCLSKEPSLRYKSVEELLDVILKL